MLGRTLEDLCFETDGDAFEHARYELAQGRSARTETTFRRQGTEQRRVHDQLEQQHQFVTAVLSSLPGVFYMMDGQQLVQWNDELERVTGLSSEELTKATAGDVIVEAAEVREQVDTALKTGKAAMEGHVRTSSGGLVPYLLTGRRVMRGGSHRRPRERCSQAAGRACL